MPAAFDELIRQGAGTDTPSEPTAEQHTERPEDLQNRQHADMGFSTVAATTRRPSTNRQPASQQKAQLKDSRHDSFAAANGAANDGAAAPPAPDALSWFLCTDEVVKPVSWDAVARCKAYILLYMRIQ